MTPFYSMRGATCGPGLSAHFIMPQRADVDTTWPIACAMQSRARSLSRLHSIGLTPKIREIIEGGPPSMLAENFETLFRNSIEDTIKTTKATKATRGCK